MGLGLPLVLCARLYFRRCGHVLLDPLPVSGQVYRVNAFLDYSCWCPACAEARRPGRVGARVRGGEQLGLPEMG